MVLVNEAGVSPERMEAKGFGCSRALKRTCGHDAREPGGDVNRWLELYEMLAGVEFPQAGRQRAKQKRLISAGRLPVAGNYIFNIIRVIYKTFFYLN